MTTQKIKIGLYGKGALNGMFLTMAQKIMPDAVFYDRSKAFMAFRKHEIELGKKGYVDPRTAVRDLPLEKMDVRVYFKQTLLNDDDIKTTVTIIHMANLKMKDLHLSTKEDEVSKNNFETVFRTHTQQIVDVIRRFSMHGSNVNVNSGLSLGRRPSTAVFTGVGRAVGRIPGPQGLLALQRHLKQYFV